MEIFKYNNFIKCLFKKKLYNLKNSVKFQLQVRFRFLWNFDLLTLTWQLCFSGDHNLFNMMTMYHLNLCHTLKMCRSSALSRFCFFIRSNKNFWTIQSLLRIVWCVSNIRGICRPCILRSAWFSVQIYKSNKIKTI